MGGMPPGQVATVATAGVGVGCCVALYLLRKRVRALELTLEQTASKLEGEFARKLDAMTQRLETVGTEASEARRRCDAAAAAPRVMAMPSFVRSPSWESQMTDATDAGGYKTADEDMMEEDGAGRTVTRRRVPSTDDGAGEPESPVVCRDWGAQSLLGETAWSCVGELPASVPAILPIGVQGGAGSAPEAAAAPARGEAASAASAAVACDTIQPTQSGAAAAAEAAMPSAAQEETRQEVADPEAAMRVLLASADSM